MFGALERGSGGGVKGVHAVRHLAFGLREDVQYIPKLHLFFQGGIFD